MRNILYITLLISILTFIAVGKSLEFALNGDDWLALYRYITTYTSFSSHFDIKNYSTNYDVANIIMGIIWRIYDINPFPYYFVSLILRIIAALSFILALNIITKNKFAAIFSGALFAVMFAGIETTNWVFNMNTYISIILLNLFLFFYFKHQSGLRLKTLIYLSVLIFMTFLTAPTRMHGLIFFIPLVVFLSIKKIDKYHLFNSFKIVAILLGPTILFRTLITRLGHSSNLGALNTSPQDFYNMLGNLFINIGYTSIPNLFVKLTNSKLDNNQLYLSMGITTILFLGFFFWKTLNRKDKLGLIGLISLLSSIAFLVIPGLVNPTSFFPSDHRYLIIPGGFLAITFSSFIAILYQKRGFFKTLALFIALILFFINIFSLRYYFNFLATSGRLAKDSDRIFSYIKSNVPIIDKNAPTVFLFVSNDGNFLYHAVNFGFTPHMLVLNSDYSGNQQQAPLAVESLESLKSILRDPNGSELYRYGYKPVKIPLENVYSFYVDQEKILNYTNEVRKLVN